jgi:hypothetical protein
MVVLPKDSKLSVITGISLKSHEEFNYEKKKTQSRDTGMQSSSFN